MSRGKTTGISGRPITPKPRPTEEAVLAVLRRYYGVDLSTLQIFDGVQELRVAQEDRVIDALWTLKDRGDVERLPGPVGALRWRLRP